VRMKRRAEGWKEERLERSNSKSIAPPSYILKTFLLLLRSSPSPLLQEIMVDDKLVTLQIWDTAGQERFQSLGVAFYRGADACILVYDITNPRSFEQLESWRQEFLVQANPSDEDSFPFVVLGNKVDKDSERRVNKNKAAAWCKQKSGSADNQIPHMETSAKEAVKVEAAFVAAAKLALANDRNQQDDIFIPETIQLNNTQKQQGGGGCC